MEETPSEPQAAEVARDAYDALDALNWSRLKLLEQSPAHFKNKVQFDSTSFRLGTAAHMAILEPARFQAEVHVATVRMDGRTKAWQEEEKAATRAGKTLFLTKGDYSDAVSIRESVMSNRKARELLTGGKPEETIVWTIKTPSREFKCKGRADYVGSGLVDLKSTQSAAPNDFAWSCQKFGYWGQAAWYSDGLALATGERLPFYFIAVEKKFPFITQVYSLPETLLERGRDQYVSLLAKLADCQDRNWWGGYSESEVLDLTLPQRQQSEES